MPNQFQNVVSDIRKYARLVNTLCDSAARTVNRVEAFLNQENFVGTTYFVPYRAYAWIGYARVGGKFRIVIRSETPDPDRPDYSDAGITPWVENVRMEKLASFVKLPDLLSKIAKELADAVKSAEATGGVCSLIFESIGSGTPEQ